MAENACTCTFGTSRTCPRHAITKRKRLATGPTSDATPTPEPLDNAAFTARLHEIVHGSDDKCAYGGFGCPIRRDLRLEVDRSRVTAPIVAPEVDDASLTEYVLGFCPEKGRGNAILSVEGELTLLGKNLVRGLAARIAFAAGKFPDPRHWQPVSEPAPASTAALRDEAETFARKVVGTVFDNTAASPETLKQTVIERIVDSVTPLSTLAKAAAEEIAANYEVHKDRWSF